MGRILAETDEYSVALSFKAPITSVPMDVGYFGGNGRTMTACVDDIMAFVKGANLPPEIAAALTPASLDSVPQSQQFRLTGDDPAPAPGLEWIDGVTVDGLFTLDNWQTRNPSVVE